MFTVAHIVYGVLYLVFFLFFSTLCLPSFAIILMGKRVSCFALTVLLMFCDNQCSVVLLTVPWACLRCVVVVFPDHTHLLL